MVHRAVRRTGWRRPRHVEKRRRGPCGGAHGQSLGREGNWVFTWLGAHCCSGDHGRGLGGWGCKRAGPGLGLVAPLRQVAVPGRGRSPGEGLFGEEERPAGKPALEAPWRRGGGGVCKASYDPVWADSPEDGAAVPQISGDSACLTGNSDSLSLWLPATYIERVFVNINH